MEHRFNEHRFRYLSFSICTLSGCAGSAVSDCRYSGGRAGITPFARIVCRACTDTGYHGAGQLPESIDDAAAAVRWGYVVLLVLAGALHTGFRSELPEVPVALLKGCPGPLWRLPV